MDVNFRNAGRFVGSVIMRLKPAFQYIFYLAMIAYECYDCVSDGMNVYLYSEGESVDVSSRNESVYYAFLFSLVVSVLSAITSSFGYILMIVGLSKYLRKHRTEKNNVDIFKLGRLVVFFSLLFQVCFEESIQCVVLYYYIIRCSVSFTFWKLSLFVCVSLSLLYASYTFCKGAFVWCKRRDTLSSKYPLCFAHCYDSKPSVVGFIALCMVGMLLGLAMFAVNITTLTDIIKLSEIDVPHIVAKNGPHGAIKISPIKDLVFPSSKTLTKKLPCTMANKDLTEPSHFLGDRTSINCSSIIISMSLEGSQKIFKYKISYCDNINGKCKAAKQTNLTLEFTHGLCTTVSPIFDYFAGPKPSTNTSTQNTENG